MKKHFQTIMLTLNKSLQIIAKDRSILFISFVPVFLGIILYSYIGKLIFIDLRLWVKTQIIHFLGQGALGSISTNLLTLILTLILFLLMNWTFVLFVSIISSPFNDIICGRVERNFLSKNSTSLKLSFGQTISRGLGVISNEIKKIMFLIVLGMMALILNFFPLLAPISFLLTSILLSIQFLDYSWSRHNMSFGQCVADVKRHFFLYFILGAIFFFLLAIPILNLFFLPFGVLVYSILWMERNKI